MAERKHKRGSENRHRQKQVSVRLSDAEHADLLAAAARLGTQPASVLRDAFLASVTPKPATAEGTS